MDINVKGFINELKYSAENSVNAEKVCAETGKELVRAYRINCKNQKSTYLSSTLLEDFPESFQEEIIKAGGELKEHDYLDDTDIRWVIC